MSDLSPVASETEQETRATPTQTEQTTPALEPPQGSPSTPQAENEGNSESEGASADDKPRGKLPPSARIAKVVGERNVERARRVAAEERNADLERKLRELSRANPDDFDERENNRLRRVMTEQQLEDNKREIAERRAGEHNARVDEFEERMQEAADRLPEGTFEKFKGMRVTTAMADFLFETELAPEFAHYLTTNAKDAAKLAELTDERKATAETLREAERLMARIEARLKPAEKRRTTSAPSAGTTLKGGTAPSGKSVNEMSQDEYNDFMNAKERQSR